jgi:hypothetical protein
LAVAGLAIIIGLDREPAFYPTVLIVVASYYVLFALMEASGRALVIEIVVASGFVLFAIIGYKRNLWLVPSRLFGTEASISLITYSLKTPAYPTDGQVSVWCSM